MLVLKTTSPPVSPAAPAASPSYQMPFSSASVAFIVVHVARVGIPYHSRRSRLRSSMGVTDGEASRCAPKLQPKALPPKREARRRTALACGRMRSWFGLEGAGDALHLAR